jgi:carbamoyltransferase
MDVLGINAYHADASAALIRDGRVIAAVEEERFNRIKHSAGFPADAVRYCLRQGGVDIRSIDAIAVASKPIEHVREEILQILSGRPAYSRQIKKRLEAVAKFRDVRKVLASEFGVRIDSLPPLKEIPHHMAHVASAYYQSGFPALEGESALLSIDGFGDFCSTLLARAEGNEIEVVDEVLFPHSIGILYTMVTQFCGFNKYGDEGKLMGLAAFGEPIYADRLRQIIELDEDGLFALDPDYFTHPVYGIDMIWEGSVPLVDDIFSERMIKTFGPPRHRYSEVAVRERDLAASLQLITEEAVLHVLKHLKREVPSARLAYSGGVALNCLANGRVLRESGFDDIYLASAPNDAGTAIGCALKVVADEGKGQEVTFAERVEGSRFGPSYTSKQIEEALAVSGLHYYRSQNIATEVAALLAEGHIVGWFNGRMEFGPRALGGRSILADPRSVEMRNSINARVKFREEFRPFAASILEEHLDDFFPGSPKSPFMLYAIKVAEDKRDLIPAVIHADGTCRVQSVSKTSAPDYYELISAFNELTGIPMILNTSFNENEPIVCSPEDAISVFNTTHMDVLVIDRYVVKR